MSEFESFIRDLNSSDLKTKINAMEGLGELGDSRAISALAELINDSNERIRECSIWNLGRLKANKILIANLHNDLEDVRIKIIEILGINEVEAALEPLINLLKDPNEEIRANSAWSLGKIENKKALEPLIECLNDEKEVVRENAAWALGKLNDIKAIPFLLKTMADPDEIVNNNAKEAIEKIYSYLEEQETLKSKLGTIYECSSINEFCNKEEKNIEKFSDKHVKIEIYMSKNCRTGKICTIKLFY